MAAAFAAAVGMHPGGIHPAMAAAAHGSSAAHLAAAPGGGFQVQNSNDSTHDRKQDSRESSPSLLTEGKEDGEDAVDWPGQKPTQLRGTKNELRGGEGLSILLGATGKAGGGAPTITGPFQTPGGPNSSFARWTAPQRVKSEVSQGGADSNSNAGAETEKNSEDAPQQTSTQQAAAAAAAAAMADVFGGGNPANAAAARNMFWHHPLYWYPSGPV